MIHTQAILSQLERTGTYNPTEPLSQKESADLLGRGIPAACHAQSTFAVLVARLEAGLTNQPANMLAISVIPSVARGLVLPQTPPPVLSGTLVFS
jgi:hypothetical protein